MPAEPRRSDLERLGPAVGAQRNGLRIGDQLTRRQRQGGVDHVGEPVGDVVEAAGEQSHVAAAAMDLYSGAVQLGLENRGAAELFECFADPAGGLCQHRAHGGADPQPEIREPVGAAGQCHRRDGRQISAEHCRAPDVRGRDPRGAGHCVGHHSGQCALAQLTAEQSAQERLLVDGGRAEQRGKQCGPAVLRSRSGARPDLGQGGINTGHRQHRRIGGCGQRAKRGPSHPDLALGEFAGQPGDGDRDLVRIVGRLRQ